MNVSVAGQAQPDPVGNRDEVSGSLSTKASEAKQRADACRQFEALLLRQVLSQARKPLLNTKAEGGGTCSSIYRDMVTDQLAESMSKAGGLGLAKSLDTQLAPPESLVPVGPHAVTDPRTPIASRTRTPSNSNPFQKQ